MRVETKFSLGDTIWFKNSDNEYVSSQVINIRIFVFNDGDIQIRYNTLGHADLNEKFLFASKPLI